MWGAKWREQEWNRHRCQKAAAGVGAEVTCGTHLRVTTGPVDKRDELLGRQQPNLGVRTGCSSGRAGGTQDDFQVLVTDLVSPTADLRRYCYPDAKQSLEISPPK